MNDIRDMWYALDGWFANLKIMGCEYDASQDQDLKQIVVFLKDLNKIQRNKAINYLIDRKEGDPQ